MGYWASAELRTGLTFKRRIGRECLFYCATRVSEEDAQMRCGVKKKSRECVGACFDEAKTDEKTLQTKLLSALSPSSDPSVVADRSPRSSRLRGARYKRSPDSAQAAQNRNGNLQSTYPTFGMCGLDGQCFA